jgi:hypothetical protein
MLPDPYTIAAHPPTAALVFQVIRSDGYGTERRDAAGAFTVVTTHDKNKGGDRHYMKVVETKDATNPYTGTTSKQQASVSISINIPPFGWTSAQAIALVAVLTDILADSEVTVANILNFQS